MATPTHTTTARSLVSFASLPAELRNEIYNYTLLQHDPIFLPYAYEKLPFHEPALLNTTPWIRAESAPIFYGSNTFEAPSPLAAHDFLAQQTPHAISLIKHFRPVDLIIPVSAQRRWFEALRWNVNKLGMKRWLSPDAVEIPMRHADGEVLWYRLGEIEGFEVVWDVRGEWRVEWKDDMG